LRPGLPPLTRYFHALPIDDRGYPIPFFVSWINGVPDFRVADPRKKAICVKEHRCWLCGQQLGRHLAWVIGPMCAINRVSSEPPQHLDCADFAARACPFLVRPAAKRREAILPDDLVKAAGVGLERNPGCALVWVARSFKLVRVDGTAPSTTPGILFQIGDPTETRWYCEGRRATAAEVATSIYSGLPLLLDIARRQDIEERTGNECERALFAQVARASALFPA
jgi:hypothetical protein